MDPNANIQEQVKLASLILDNPGQTHRERDQMAYDAERLAELVLALDEWLSKGGFKPERWTVIPENKEAV